MSITSFLSKHHSHCDVLFADAETACLAGKWDEGARLFDEMRAALESHLKSEERILFPAFETGTGMVTGPTSVMRMEHGQMRELLEAMAEAVKQRNAESYSGYSETLLVLMQQHNMKEEGILYPMCDRVLDSSALVTELDKCVLMEPVPA